MASKTTPRISDVRYIGSYGAAATPGYAAFASASTADRRGELTTLTHRINDAGRLYSAAIPDVHLVARIRLSAADKQTLIEGYDHRSAAVKRLLESMRKSLPSDHRDLCPYCSLDTTYQLDHYLPKSKYPEFSLYGPNLLPICGRCNQIKSNAITDAGGRRLFVMPSGDSFLRQDLIVANLSMVPVPRFTFAINLNAPVDANEILQAQRHFNRLGLAKRYRRRANALLAPLRAAVRKSGRRQSAARKLILANLRSAANEGPNNSWRLPMYRAIFQERHAFKKWLLT